MVTPGAPVFSDDSGRRRKSLQVLGRAVVALIVLFCGTLALSLVLGVPLPGLDRLLPLPGQEQDHEATRQAPSISHGARTDRPETTHQTSYGDATAKDTRTLSVHRAVSGRSAAATSATSATSSPAAAGTTSGQQPAEPASQPGSTGVPSATPSAQPENPSGKPAPKARNPHAATPARGKSALSSSRAHRAAASPSAAPSQTAPGKSGTSHGKSGTSGSG